MKRTSRWSLPVARVAGIDIRVHVTFLFLVALFAVPYEGGPTVAENLAFLVVVAVCIVLHELAHSVVARQRGATVVEILLLPIGGVSKLEHLPESPADEFAIAIVGPATSLALAVFGALIALAAGVSLWPIALATGSLLHRAVWFNLVVGLFNLLPAFPLDGGRVFRSMLERRYDLETATRRAARLGRALAITLAVAGVLVNIWLLLIGVFVYFGASAEEAATIVHLRIKGRTVGDAMLFDPVTVDVDGTAADVDELSRRTSQRWLPVVEQGRYVGLLDTHTLVLHPRDAPIARLAIRPEPLDAAGDLEAAFERLQTERLGALPVVDRTGHVVGLLRIEDVAHLAERAAGQHA